MMDDGANSAFYADSTMELGCEWIGRPLKKDKSFDPMDFQIETARQFRRFIGALARVSV